MKVKISSVFHKSAVDVWPLVKKSSTLLYVTKGLLGFVNASEFPRDWIEGSRERSNLQFFGFLPAWNHEIKFNKIDDDNYILYTNETGGLVTTWNHSIKVEKLSEFTCTYTDEVEIEAGLFTPLMWI